MMSVPIIGFLDMPDESERCLETYMNHGGEPNTTGVPLFS